MQMGFKKALEIHVEAEKSWQQRKKRASDRHKQLSVNDLTQSHSSNSNVNVLQFPIRSQRGELKIN